MKINTGCKEPFGGRFVKIFNVGAGVSFTCGAS
jgi:hypothetical protein